MLTASATVEKWRISPSCVQAMKKGVMTAMPVTPMRSNSLANCNVSNVAGMPALTMTSALPPTSSTTSSSSFTFSEWVSAEKSPLVPAHMMLLPAATWRRTCARVAW
ncbi:hypothetical protein D3C80_1819830 [compost metagenome]